MKKLVFVILILAVVAVGIVSACFADTGHKSFVQAKLQTNLAIPVSEDMPVNELDYRVRYLRELRDNPEMLAEFLEEEGAIDKYLEKAKKSREKHIIYVLKDLWHKRQSDISALVTYFYDDGELWEEAYEEAKVLVANMSFDDFIRTNINIPTPIQPSSVSEEINDGHIDMPE